jgi:hypothetical protein
MLTTDSMALPNDSHGSKLDTVLDTASSTSHQAADRVFTTPELLCGIAAHLSRKEIFVAMGVCRTWRNTLLGDPTIQQTLFLKPIEVHEVTAEDIQLLDLEYPISIQDCNIIGEVNPWISDICGSVYGSFSLHPSVNLDFQSCRGLWREMFVTQPPCKTVTVVMDSHPLTNDVVRLKFEREVGVKMGELYDFIEREMHYRPECRGSKVYIKNFDTEKNAHSWHLPTTRCKVRDGEVCRPAQLSKPRAYSGSENSQDSKSNESEDGNDVHDGHDESQGILSYADYGFESEEEYSDDYEDPDEFAAEQADEADRYFRW